jgi:GAF domain-containing protein
VDQHRYPAPISVGERISLGGRNTHTLVFQTGRPARIDDYDAASGESADVARKRGIRSTVGVPISVEGRLWGVMAMTSRREPPPADTEARLARSTELVAAAIASGSRLAGLQDRAEALGGRFSLHSPPGAGTVLEIALPLGDPIGRG